VRALGSADAPTDLSLRLDYRLQHILVDEFQDTSGAQLELVKLLTSGWQDGDGRSIFCVGDPMQSIYGFRQAEVRAFLELAEEGIGEVRFDVARLRSNFRSDKNLVEWINSCFSRILPRSDDRQRGAIAFRPSEAARRPTNDNGVAAHAGVSVRGFATRVDEAHAIAELIATELKRHPEWRVVILVRARSHAREIAANLRARAIHFRAVDIEPLQDRPVVRDLVMLIGGLLHLGDRTAWLALLRAPWVGLTLADLLRVARARPVIWEALLDDAVLSELSLDGRERCERLRTILHAAFLNRHSSSVSRWVEQTWLALGGAACFPGADDLGHVATVLARLRELEEQGLPDPADLVQRFSDLYAEHRGDASVEIMTIHKSKGLEFDLVVVPALDKHTPANRSQLLLSHEFARTGRSGLVMAARPGVGGEADRLFDYLRHQTRDAANLEAERLLYVACTRAKWQLHLTAVVTANSEPDSGERDEGKPRAGSLLGVLWPVCREAFALSARQHTAGEAPESVAAEAPRGGPLQRVPAAWSPPAYLGPALPEASLQAPRTETPVFDWAGETARRVGSLVHAELQVLDVAASDAASIKNKRDHYRAWLALHGVPEERLQQASARVMEALMAVHGDERGRWILHKGYRDDFREHALSGVWQGEVVRVVFDRSFIDQDGVRWVIDYKTSQHEGGNLDEFLEREVERYRPQLDRYAHFARKLGPEPVRVGLYFPLMRAWRDWKP
jgi:ATP-dependent exoDNAse (exonuclease V) beta subunit